MNELVAALVAIAGAITFGASDVIEQRATHRVAKRPPLDLRLFADLAVNRLWLIGITVDIAASALQAIALHFGSLALVQPILVLDLLFAVVITAALARRRPDRVIVAGVLCCTGGLVLFLAVARPQSPAVSVAPTILLPLGAGIAGAIALCLVAWRASPRRFLPLATAFACGAIFGVTAFLLKEITQTIGLGFNPPSQQWPLYAFIVAEPIGFLLNQNAFQESSLIAPVLAIRTVTDPLVAIGIGLVWLNEQIASSPAAIAAEVVGLIVMSVGVLALAYRSPHVAAQSSGSPLKSQRRDDAERRLWPSAHRSGLSGVPPQTQRHYGSSSAFLGRDRLGDSVPSSASISVLPQHAAPDANSRSCTSRIASLARRVRRRGIEFHRRSATPTS